MNKKKKEEAVELKEVRQSSGPFIYQSNNVGCGCGSSAFWGFLLLFTGVFWFAQNIGWIDRKISIVPILLIIIAVYFLFFRSRKK